MNKLKKKRTADFFIQNDTIKIDYKNIEVLKKFLSPEGKILPARRSGLISKNHRKLANAIKRARIINLLPFINKEI
jgi:small subunit ribosomal protein S18